MSSLLDRRPLAVLAAGAATVSLAPILVKAVAHWNVGPVAIALWRCAIGGALLIALSGALRQSLAVPKRLALLLALAGVAFAVDLTVWHYSIFLAGAGMATILGNTQVFFTAILATLFFGERLSLRFLAAAAGALAGLVLLLQPVLANVWSALLLDETLAPLQVIGALITLASIYAGSVRR